jgi:hypothetical protein
VILLAFLLSALADSPPPHPLTVEPTSAADVGEPGPGDVTPPLGWLPPNVRAAAEGAVLLPLAQRMRAVSEPFLDAPYVNDPLGEGMGHDADPFARYDVFDCLTFVEEVLALSFAGDPAHSAWIRSSLRYGDAEPNYASRRHFMELQWIPGNLEAGWLRDVGAEYGETTRFEREVTMGLWRAWSKRDTFAHTDDQLPVGVMSLNVLSLEEALRVVDEIRPGSIVMTVREDRPWIPLWITHLGFVVPGEGEPMIRHASRMKSSMRVRDHKLRWYLEQLQEYKHWKAAGISIYEPVEYGPRLGSLPEQTH